jgi:hypothetical protein
VVEFPGLVCHLPYRSIYIDGDEDEDTGSGGNINRNLWKYACYKIAQDVSG